MCSLEEVRLGYAHSVFLTYLREASEKGTLANSVAPHQMPQNAASDQSLHCLHQMQEFL